MSDSLWPHELQHTRPPCLSPTPRVLFKLMPIESVTPSSHLILCRPLLLLPPIPPSIRVFSSESALRIRWPKYWSFSFSISPSNEHSGLISFRMDWLDLLAVQGTFKCLLQHHSSKASIFLHSVFFTVQLSHPYYYVYLCSTVYFFRWVSQQGHCWPKLDALLTTICVCVCIKWFSKNLNTKLYSQEPCQTQASLFLLIFTNLIVKNALMYWEIEYFFILYFPISSVNCYSCPFSILLTGI